MLTHMPERRGPHLFHLDGSGEFLVCLLGGFRVLNRGQPLETVVAGKATTLLAALALHLETGVPRETLLDLLWPEQDPQHAIVSLHSLIYSLHRRLRLARRDTATVLYANGSYALNRDGGVSTDIARFDALVAEGTRLAAADQEAEAAQVYEDALRLYRGDLALGTDVSAVIERERLRADFLTLLAWLADRAYRHADFAAALEHALRLLTHDPCREDAHRVVMRAHVRRGQRAQAMRQYRLCEQVLRREFDAVPEAATTALFDGIRSNREPI